MKRWIIVCLLTVFLFAGISFSLFGQSELLNIQRGVVSFSEDIARALPFNSSLGLNWADAYIGKVYPDSPAHFGMGLSLGATTMNPSSIETLADYLGTDISLGMAKLPIPAYTVEGRLGGFFIPFDIGLKFGFLPPIGIREINFNYLMAGGDIRFAILDGKTKTNLPNLSLGTGFSYLKGGIGGNIGEAQTINYNYFGDHRIDLSRPEVNLNWDCVSLELKAQISKTFSIVTPYLGFGGSYSLANAGYSVDADVRLDGVSVTQSGIDNLNSFLISQGLDPVNINASGISSVIKNNAFNVRAYGGFSLKLSAFVIDLTGLFNFMDQNFGGGLGLRFQL
jgi:hypothetical protein